MVRKHKISINFLYQNFIQRNGNEVNDDIFVWKWFSFMVEWMFEGVSEDSRRMGVRDPRYHSSVWV